MRAERSGEQPACGPGQRRAGSEQPPEGGKAAGEEQLPRKPRWASGREPAEPPEGGRGSECGGVPGSEGPRAGGGGGQGAAAQGRRQGGAEVAMGTPVTQSGGEEEV